MFSSFPMVLISSIQENKRNFAESRSNPVNFVTFLFLPNGGLMDRIRRKVFISWSHLVLKLEADPAVIGNHEISSILRHKRLLTKPQTTNSFIHFQTCIFCKLTQNTLCHSSLWLIYTAWDRDWDRARDRNGHNRKQ